MSKKSSPSKSSQKSKNKDDPTSSGGQLPGWPGYRTREGRTGYDPIDTRTEAAHTAGTIIQKLFRGHVRKPPHLFLLGLLGLVLVVPLILAIAETMNGNLFSWNAWLFLLIAGVAGLAILLNFIRNMIRMFFR